MGGGRLFDCTGAYTYKLLTDDAVCRQFDIAFGAVRAFGLPLSAPGRECTMVYFIACLDNWLVGTDLLLLLSVEFRQYVYTEVRLTL